MYPQDLIAQAKRLARLDPRRPRQANLRRDISAAYYALFHFLIDQSCRVVMGSQQNQASYRQVLGRAFVHSDMKVACQSFSRGALTHGASQGLPARFSIPSEIKQIAAAFVYLQAKRHDADYDLSQQFSRSGVLLAIGEAELAMKRFSLCPTNDEKKFFLASLWAWKNLARRY